MQGKVVFITGAARGIGAESARRLAARGARVALVGLEPDELEQVARSCGPDAVALEADVTDRAALDAAVVRTVERFGGIDAVVANAGIGGAGLVRSADPEVFERVIEVNLLGVWRTVRACLPAIMERRGYVLVVASVAAINTSFPLAAPYAMSKAGVEAFGNTLRIEMAHHGVDVGVGYFSWIATDLVAGGDEHPSFRLLRDSLKGPFGRTYPVGDAADAVVRGIERREAHVLAPRWLRALMLARGLLPLVGDPQMRKLMPEAERLFEAEGPGAGRPVGPGGEAAMRAVEEREREAV
jgi:NAD(P)-dependent dehydrogenase (short-subunit alcohol dehydrogenase family)